MIVGIAVWGSGIVLLVLGITVFHKPGCVKRTLLIDRMWVKIVECFAGERAKDKLERELVDERRIHSLAIRTIIVGVIMIVAGTLFLLEFVM